MRHRNQALTAQKLLTAMDWLLLLKLVCLVFELRYWGSLSRTGVESLDINLADACNILFRGVWLMWMVLISQGWKIARDSIGPDETRTLLWNLFLYFVCMNALSYGSYPYFLLTMFLMNLAVLYSVGTNVRNTIACMDYIIVSIGHTLVPDPAQQNIAEQLRHKSNVLMVFGLFCRAELTATVVFMGANFLYPTDLLLNTVYSSITFLSAVVLFFVLRPHYLTYAVLSPTYQVDFNDTAFLPHRVGSAVELPSSELSAKFSQAHLIQYPSAIKNSLGPRLAVAIPSGTVTV